MKFLILLVGLFAFVELGQVYGICQQKVKEEYRPPRKCYCPQKYTGKNNLNSNFCHPEDPTQTQFRKYYCPHTHEVTDDVMRHLDYFHFELGCPLCKKTLDEAVEMGKQKCYDKTVCEKIKEKLKKFGRAVRYELDKCELWPL